MGRDRCELWCASANGSKSTLGIKIVESDMMPNDVLLLMPPIPEAFSRFKGEGECERRVRHSQEFPAQYGKIVLDGCVG